MNQIFIKQLTYKNHGQVYLYLVANFLYRKLFEQNLLSGLDYQLTADNFDGLVAISCQSQPASIQTITTLLNNLTFTEIDVKRALQQASCANQRRFQTDIQQLIEIFNQTTDWQSLDNFQSSQPISPKAWSFSAPALNFSPKINRQYQTFDVFYSLDQSVFTLKPLTCEIIQALQEIVSSILYHDPQTPACYQLATFWAEYQYEKSSDLVGLQQQLRFQRGQISSDQLTVRLSQILKQLTERDLAQCLFKKLQTGRTTLDYQTLFQASSQLVGSSYWGNIQLTDIREILDSLINNLTVQSTDSSQ